MIPTEPIGSVPRPDYLVQALARGVAGAELSDLQGRALSDTVLRFAQTGSPIISDGEQSKSSFVTYPLEGATCYSSDGVEIEFADGHIRQLPRLTSKPFRYMRQAGKYTSAVRGQTDLLIKQAVIAPSALSLLYLDADISSYSRDQFLVDLVDECEADIRSCFQAGAHSVQMDFTEGRLSLKLDPSGALLQSFVDLNNSVLDRFSEAERARIGVHTCPGGDQDSVHSLDVDYADLLPALFGMRAGSFFIELSAEPEPERVLSIAAKSLPQGARLYVGVINPIDPAIESVATVRDRVLRAAEYIPLDQLGTCDDCGFSPFADDTSTSRDVAFAKIAARVEGTAEAAAQLGL